MKIAYKVGKVACRDCCHFCQNTIVMLGTGQGKTLIAILSMKYFLETQPKKQVWCLVPSVALAIQLANVIRANLPYRVGVVCHTSEHSDTARSDWSTAPTYTCSNAWECTGITKALW